MDPMMAALAQRAGQSPGAPASPSGPQVPTPAPGGDLASGLAQVNAAVEALVSSGQEIPPEAIAQLARLAELLQGMGGQGGAPGGGGMGAPGMAPPPSGGPNGAI